MYVAGNPKGLEGSFSKGIVSALRHDRQLIQIDAAISPGSSGGPVVNTHGDVVGVAAASLIGGQNLNFAIPIEFLARLKNKWTWQVWAAGGLAITALDRQHLKGPVRKVTTIEAEYGYDKDNNQYLEKERQIKRVEEYGLSGETIQTALYEDKGVAKIRHNYSELGCANHITGIKFDGSEYVISDFTEYECLSGKAKAGNFSITKNHSFIDGSTLSQTFDREGNEIKVIEVTSDKKFTARTETSYDEKGNQVEQKVFSNEKPLWVFRYKYEYERYGNWIKQIKYRLWPSAPELGFVPDSVTYREITYFER